METNNRHNRWGYDQDNRNRQSNHYQRVDEDSYRGAYRFDNDSDHSHETSYDGFDLNDSMARDRDHNRYGGEKNQGGDYVYRRSLNTQDNDRRYGEQYGHQYDRRHDFRNRNYINDERGYHDRFGSRNSNFNNRYAPDPYRNQHSDQNYGNMAGSLSFGYDGDYNADPDYRRRYDPMSGQIRQYGEDNSRRDHPGKYGPPDRYGINPDYDRY